MSHVKMSVRRAIQQALTLPVLKDSRLILVEWVPAKMEVKPQHLSSKRAEGVSPEVVDAWLKKVYTQSISGSGAA